MKKIVITGASGFLGKNLIKKLEIREDLMVFAVSAHPNDPAFAKVSARERGVIGTEAAEELFAGAYVVNCAFPRGGKEADRAAGMAYIKDLFLCCEKNRAAAVINISSQSVYKGTRSNPAKETDPVCIDTVYAAEKYAVELMSECVFGRSGIPYTNIRLASLIGPGFDVRIVNRFVKQAQETNEIRVTDDNRRFGFLDVSDAADGIISMIESDPRSWKPVYNLGIIGSYTLMEMAAAVKSVFKTDGIDIALLTSPGENEEDSSLDASLFYKEFSFQPAVTLEESIRRIRDGF